MYSNWIWNEISKRKQYVEFLDLKLERRETF